MYEMDSSFESYKVHTTVSNDLNITTSGTFCEFIYTVKENKKKAFENWQKQT